MVVHKYTQRFVFEHTCMCVYITKLCILRTHNMINFSCEAYNNTYN